MIALLVWSILQDLHHYGLLYDASQLVQRFVLAGRVNTAASMA